MVTETLTTLHNWFSEPSVGNERPKLLSKLAILELCGWLEGWMDEFVLELSRHCLSDDKWVNDHVIERTNGFDYSQHLRPMLCKVLGEHLTRCLEAEFAVSNPGDLEQIKSTLGSLWTQRCKFAHADLLMNVATQATFNAPSWTQNQHRVLQKKLEALKSAGLKLAKSAQGLKVN
jgi:hypothetical protein